MGHPPEREEPTIKRIAHFGLATLVGLATSIIVAGGGYVLGFWLGRNSQNLREMVYLGVPIALLAGILAAILAGGAIISAYPTSSAILFGGLLGALYTQLVFRYLTLGDMGIVVQGLSCWVAVGVCSILAAGPRGRWRKPMAVACVWLIAIFLPKTVFDAATHNQQLTTVFVVRSASSAGEAPPAAINFTSDSEVHAITREAIDRVRAVGLSERLHVAYLSRQGTGKESLAIIVMPEQVEKQTSLPEPNGTTVVYVLREGTWRSYPPNAPTLGRRIELRPAESHHDAVTYFSIPDAAGVSLVGRIP